MVKEVMEDIVDGSLRQNQFLKYIDNCFNNISNYFQHVTTISFQNLAVLL